MEIFFCLLQPKCIRTKIIVYKIKKKWIDFDTFIYPYLSSLNEKSQKIQNSHLSLYVY